MKKGVPTYCKMVVEVSQLPHPATSISTVATHDLKWILTYGKEVLESYSMSFFFIQEDYSGREALLQASASFPLLAARKSGLE